MPLAAAVMPPVQVVRPTSNGVAAVRRICEGAAGRLSTNALDSVIALAFGLPSLMRSWALPPVAICTGVNCLPKVGGISVV